MLHIIHTHSASMKSKSISIPLLKIGIFFTFLRANGLQDFQKCKKMSRNALGFAISIGPKHTHAKCHALVLPGRFTTSMSMEEREKMLSNH